MMIPVEQLLQERNVDNELLKTIVMKHQLW